MKKEDFKKCLLAGLAAGAVLATSTPAEAAFSEQELNSALAFGGNSCGGKSSCGGAAANAPAGSYNNAQPVVYGSAPTHSCGGRHPISYSQGPSHACGGASAAQPYYYGQPTHVESGRVYGQPSSSVYYAQPQQGTWSNTSSTQTHFDNRGIENRSWGNSGLKEAAPGSQTQWNNSSPLSANNSNWDSTRNSSQYSVGQPSANFNTQSSANFDQNNQPKDASPNSSSNTRR